MSITQGTIRAADVFFFSVLLILLEFFVNAAQEKIDISSIRLVDSSFHGNLCNQPVWFADSLGKQHIHSAARSYRSTQRNPKTAILRGNPQGFGDLMVKQSISGRIFGYGNIIVNSQGERQTKLRLAYSPFEVVDKIRNIMGKPIVRVEPRIKQRSTRPPK